MWARFALWRADTVSVPLGRGIESFSPERQHPPGGDSTLAGIPGRDRPGSTGREGVGRMRPASLGNGRNSMALLQLFDK